MTSRIEQQQQQQATLAADAIEGADKPRNASDDFWEHEYKQGETLIGIALAYGVSGERPSE